MNIPDNRIVKFSIIGVTALILGIVTFALLSVTTSHAAAKVAKPRDLKLAPLIVKPKPAGPTQGQFAAYYHNHHLPPAPVATPSPMPGPAPVQAPVVASTGISIPGMPQSLANCIWFRESTNGTNPAAGGNQFGIIPASGFSVAGDSVAQQEQVAGQIYAQSGGAAWAADGCPGT